MVNALLTLFGTSRFIGPGKPPKRWDKPEKKQPKLLSRDFVLLFLMAMCSNSFIAVYYCFEQWLQGLGIPPSWRGILLSALFAMILIFRPLASVIMLKHGKLWPMVISLAVCTGVMAVYPFVTPDNAIGVILALRLVQGIALAIYSACTVGVLVECIPPGQSARGFALFSLTMLLPYSIIPALSEELLPMLGGEARLFAVMAWLGLPSFFMVFLMSKRLRKTQEEVIGNGSHSIKEVLHSVAHSGLAFVYLACLSFSMTTVMAIFFMKGLCGQTGGHPAWFFSAYSTSIIIVRVLGSRMMDTLPRYRVSIFCSGLLALCMLAFAFAPLWAFVPVSCTYGLSLGLLYPLLAAAVYDRSTPDTRSINSNVMMATFDASGMLAPMLGGAVIAGGFDYRAVFVRQPSQQPFVELLCFWTEQDKKFGKRPERMEENKYASDCMSYIGAIVLGMNDALVEMTGALAGFTMALGENNLIALAGFTTGIAATLSMAASEFLSLQAAESRKRPGKAALFTGIAYLLTVGILLLPYFLFSSPYMALTVCLALAACIILVFTLVISRIRKTCFKRDFLRMLSISFGVAGAAFLISWLAKSWWGITV